ncbi:MAG: transaldolase, partial [Proteobacteria bacterium]|nr:transaldolase [Pseudomonadota bacterium]
NRLGIAMAERTYKVYRDMLNSDRWMRLTNYGVHPQRLLWASTGTKDPQASDYLYVKALASPNTVNTMPEGTLLKFGEHGELGRILSAGGGESDEVVYALERQGIDMDELAAQLQKEGAESFVKSWDEMMGVVAKKAQTFK